MAKMTGVPLRCKWIPRKMFVGPGLEPALLSGRLSYLVPSVVWNGERKGGVSASNGSIEAFWSSVHAFSSKRIHITRAMDRAP
jgi:hypothetical protein